MHEGGTSLSRRTWRHARDMSSLSCVRTPLRGLAFTRAPRRTGRSALTTPACVQGIHTRYHCVHPTLKHRYVPTGVEGVGWSLHEKGLARLLSAAVTRA